METQNKSTKFLYTGRDLQARPLRNKLITIEIKFIITHQSL